MGDVVSFNDYPGWYVGGLSAIKPTWQKHGTWVATHFPDKPFTISETGAGAVFNNHSSTSEKWSEEYQQELLKVSANYAMNSHLVAGISIWQFTDIKVDLSNTSYKRPGGINNKGVFSQYRE